MSLSPARRSGRAGAVIPARLTLENISLTLSGQPILRDVSLEAGQSQVVCIVGPSGCGKTTLLRIAAGLDGPDAGTVSLDGRTLTGGSVFVPPEQRRIGMVFQDYALFPHLSVAANVMFGLSGMGAADQRKIALSALERVGLAAKADAYPDILSGGEQQRVALARAIVPRPSVMLMDEPFSNLDRRMRDQVRDDTMELLRETGATSIVVTHDPEEAMRVADKIVLMRGGQVVQSGTAEQLYHQPADIEAARFFCPLNELEAVVQGGIAVTPLGGFPAPGHPDGASVIIGIRPESIAVARSGGGFEGLVLTRRFLGEADIVEIGVSGLDQPLRMRGRLPAGAGQGAAVDIAVNPRDALVFPAGAA